MRLFLLLTTLILQRKLCKGKIVSNPVLRLLIISFSCFSLYTLKETVVLQNKPNQPSIPFFSDFINSANFAWRGITKASQIAGFGYGWLYQFNSTFMEKPQNYSPHNIDAIVHKYLQRAQLINQTRTQHINDQIVIYILSESFADPARIPGVFLAEDPLPYIHSLKKSNTSGLMISSGYGGGTANMEFETLTSLSLNNFTANVGIPYLQIVPLMTIVPSVTDLFTNKLAIHPALGASYNRAKVFNQLHFNPFIALSGGTQSMHITNTYGVHISDQAAYQEVLNNISNNESGKFIHLITMQSHSPYTLNEQNRPTIKVTANSLSDYYLQQLEVYTSLLANTDRATHQFLNQLAQLKSRVTVVFWGDHLPGIYYGDEITRDLSSKYYNVQHETDYFIWSNYNVPQLNYPVIAPYNFTALMLEQTNSKVSAYYALMTEVLLQLPIMELNRVFDESSNIVNNYKFSAKQTEILNDYIMVQYDLTSGNSYLKNYPQFFKVF